MQLTHPKVRKGSGNSDKVFLLPGNSSATLSISKTWQCSEDSILSQLKPEFKLGLTTVLWM